MPAFLHFCLCAAIAKGEDQEWHCRARKDGKKINDIQKKKGVSARLEILLDRRSVVQEKMENTVDYRKRKGSQQGWKFF